MRLDKADKRQRIKELYEEGLNAQQIVIRLGVSYQTAITHKPGYMKKVYKPRKKGNNGEQS